MQQEKHFEQLEDKNSLNMDTVPQRVESVIQTSSLQTASQVTKKKSER